MSIIDQWTFELHIHSVQCTYVYDITKNIFNFNYNQKILRL